MVPPKHGNLRAPKKSHLAYPSHIRTETRVFISGSFRELYRDGERAGTRIVTSSDIVRYGYFVSSRSFTATFAVEHCWMLKEFMPVAARSSIP